MVKFEDFKGKNYFIESLLIAYSTKKQNNLSYITLQCRECS